MPADEDSNSYKTVEIGPRTWFGENLKTTRYNDGQNIPLLLNGRAWASDTNGAYCWYNSDAGSYKDRYGALFNWYAHS